jgi:hypothetical protein
LELFAADPPSTVYSRSAWASAVFGTDPQVVVYK